MSKLNIYTKQITFDIPLNTIETIRKMQENTEYCDLSKFRLSLPKTKKEFLGTNKENSFNCIRNMSYRNSWRPFITLEIYESLNGSKLIASFKVHNFVQIFSYIWLTPTALLTIYSIISSLFDWHNIFIAVVPIIMGSIMLAMSLGGFNYEVKKVTTILKRILNAHETIDN